MAAPLPVAIVLAVLSAVALLLAALLLQRYLRARRSSYLYWGLGILLVFVTLAEEAALYVGVWSELLIQSYLVLVAVLVGLLSLGSAETSLPGRWRSVWFAYVIAASATMAIVGFSTPISASILYQGVVWGLPPVAVVVASVLLTVPGALLLILSSLYGAWRQHRPELLFITVGTIVISISGTLYIVAFPTTLYLAEFAGVVLLFLGFVKVPGVSAPAPRNLPS